MDSVVNFIKGVLVVILVSIGQMQMPTQNYNSEFSLKAADDIVVEGNADFLATISAQIKPSPSPKTKPKVKTTPKPTPKTNSGPNYEMVPNPNGQKDFYLLKNVPVETMSNVTEINDAVNSYRQAHGLNRLVIDSKICEYAKTRASEARANFSHDGFKNHLDAGDYNNLGFHMMGENLWQGSFTGVHIVEYGWDRSEGHRANLQGNWSRGCAGIDDTTVAFLFVN